MAQLQIEIVPILGDNYAYLMREPKSGMTAALDPAEVAPVRERLSALGWTLDWILNTHHHVDHTGGNLELKKASGCRIAGAGKDARRIPGIDVELFDGDRFALGEQEALVLDTPGHTSGHITYWFAGSSALFPGDTLFSLGCGRLLEGTAEQMWRSLSVLAALPDDAKIYCGHEYTEANARFARSIDPDNPDLKAHAEEIARLRAKGQPTLPATLGQERKSNPFLRPHDPGIKARLGMADASDVEVFAEIRKRKDRF